MADLILPDWHPLHTQLREPALLVPGQVPIGPVALSEAFADTLAVWTPSSRTHTLGRQRLPVTYTAGMAQMQGGMLATAKTDKVTFTPILDRRTTGFTQAWVLLSREASAFERWGGVDDQDCYDTGSAFAIGTSSNLNTTTRAANTLNKLTILLASRIGGTFEETGIFAVRAGLAIEIVEGAFNVAANTNLPYYTGADDGTDGAQSLHYFTLVDDKPWPKGKIESFLRNPFSVFTPANSFPYLFPIAGGGTTLPTLSDPVGFNITSSGFQPRVTATYS